MSEVRRKQKDFKPVIIEITKSIKKLIKNQEATKREKSMIVLEYFGTLIVFDASF